MGNFSFKNFGMTLFMSEMRAILKPELPHLYSKLLEACALFGCSHISGYIKLSLAQTLFLPYFSLQTRQWCLFCQLCHYFRSGWNCFGIHAILRIVYVCM